MNILSGDCMLRGRTGSLRQLFLCTGALKGSWLDSWQSNKLRMEHVTRETASGTCSWSQNRVIFKICDDWCIGGSQGSSSGLSLSKYCTKFSHWDGTHRFSIIRTRVGWNDSWTNESCAEWSLSSNLWDKRFNCEDKWWWAIGGYPGTWTFKPVFPLFGQGVVS